MTVNILWSDLDGEAAYIIVDSARTHPGVPDHAYSLINQPQAFSDRGEAVEEGAQKIVVLNDAIAFGLCGNERVLVEFIRAFQLDVGLERIPNFEHFWANLPSTANFELSMAVAGDSPQEHPFTVVQVQPSGRSCRLVSRGETHVAGSLQAEASAFIEGGIRALLIEQRRGESPEARLVAGLGIAMAAAMQFQLTENGVGGAFFGARIGSGVTWQPDIVYVLYVPGQAFTGMEAVPTPESPSPNYTLHEKHRRNLVATRVRDDVCVAVSSIGWRAVAAGHDKHPSEAQDWLKKWEKEAGRFPFPKPNDYVVFVPILPGSVVVVRPASPHVQHVADDEIAVSTVVAEALAVPNDRKGRLVFL